MPDNFPEIKNSISRVCSILGVQIDRKLQVEYQNGKHPTLLSYEKVESPEIIIPTIQKYLIGSQTILNQPCTFYDINRACRHYFFIQILSSALEENLSNVNNYEERFEKLLKETNYDSFESMLYELVVSSAYSKNNNYKNISFISSMPETSPDLEFTYNHRKVYVECKKFDRNSDITQKIRDEVRAKAHLTLDGFRKLGKSVLIEVSFHEEPRLISESHIYDICLEAYKRNTTVEDNLLTVSIKNLQNKSYKDYILFPSPMYFWERYGFKNQGEWFGITSLISAKYGYFHETKNTTDRYASTWLDEIDFECVLKWKITNKNVLWKYRKLGYNLLFKGFSQLKSFGNNSILHAWYERDGFAGHRQKELFDFFSRIYQSKKDIFSWIIFNETILNISRKGIFDLIEHSHPISGPTAGSIPPFVSSVFTHDKEISEGAAEFGIGHILPDIDDIKG